MFVNMIQTIQFQMLQNLQEPQDLLEMTAIKYLLTSSSFIF